MAKKRGAWCKIEWCDSPNDKEMGGKLCTRHAEEWRHSPEFSASLRDERVVFFMSIGAKKSAMRYVSGYRRKFVRRREAQEEI